MQFAYAFLSSYLGQNVARIYKKIIYFINFEKGKRMFDVSR